MPIQIPTERRVRLATHSGSFHADEVLGYVVLKAALGGDRTTLVRTRDPQAIAMADIAFDVGGSFDPERGRYDHHFRDAPRRADGTPYSSAGLLWRDYGRAAVRAMAGAGAAAMSDAAVEEIWREIDAAVVEPVDRIDTGVEEPRLVSLPEVVDAYNPTWDVLPEHRDAAENAGFHDAAEAVRRFLVRRVDQARARVAAREAVLEAHAASPDPRLLVLPTGMPWQGVVKDAELPVLYALYPSRDTGWMIACMPSEPGGYDQRLPLPEAWAGLRGAALAEACGVADAVFVHPGRFVGGAVSREGALEMARRALDIGLEPAAAPGPR